MRCDQAPGKVGPVIGVGPSVAAISGLVEFVGPVGQTSAHLVHASDVDSACWPRSPVIWTLRVNGLAGANCRSLVQVSPLSVE